MRRPPQCPRSHPPPDCLFSKVHMNSCVSLRPFQRAARRRCVVGVVLVAGLMALVTSAQADTDGTIFTFPIVVSILCGFWSYSKTRLAPMIAAIVVLFSVVGQWLGHARMWSVLHYIGLGL